MLAVASHEEAVETLESGDPRRVFTHGVPNTDPSIAFMFSGAGSQYPRMAAELQQPAFAITKKRLHEATIRRIEETLEEDLARALPG